MSSVRAPFANPADASLTSVRRPLVVQRPPPSTLSVRGKPCPLLADMGGIRWLLALLVCAVIAVVNATPLPSERPVVVSNSTDPDAADDTPLWSGSDYPDPRSDPFACNNDEKSPLCDPDQVLTDKWRQTVRARISAQSDSKPYCVFLLPVSTAIIIIITTTPTQGA